MANEQTAYADDDIKVLVNVIGSAGTHVAAVINTATTRLNGLSAVPTVTTVATGVYEIVFSGVTPAPAEGDRYICKVNGTIDGVAWSEYGIPVKIVADERGTDNVVVPTSDITAIKTKTDQLAFTVSNQVDANSLTGGTSPADIWTYATRTITSGGITAQEVEDAVWDASASNHNTGGTYGKHLRQIKEGQVSTDGEVNDASATAGSFITNLTSSTDEFYDDLVIAFISGNLQGQSRVINGYNGTTKSLTVEEPFTSVPANGDEFIILTLHVHPVSQITTPVIAEINATELKVDDIKAKTDQFVFTVSNQVDANSLTGCLSEAQVRDAVGLASANLDTQLDNIPTSSEIATEILAAGDVDGYSLEGTLKLCLAALAGKISGAGTGTITIRSADDTADRIVATTDLKGNRLSITIDEAG